MKAPDGRYASHMEQAPARRVTLVRGDITVQRVDAIVNAANSSLLGGGGVDGAIHRAAGPELVEYCRGLGGCPAGEARISPGFRLPARWIIHTVGPVWHGGNRDEDNVLARCYRNSLALAVRHAVRSVAFPQISTGVYGFPIRRAARIAIAEIAGFLLREDGLVEVRCVCYNDDSYRAVADALAAIG
jgi:O-acetyl-ADP-ribose deacetylase (regulator of RNase III)